MKFILIRHGLTAGNTEKRYIGCRTDEPLSDSGIRLLSDFEYPRAKIVYSSPMRRCVQTAQLIYPEHPVISIDDFRECDFGAFEGKNYDELKEDPDYLKWLDSGGNSPFPGGESRSSFSVRCIDAFDKLRRLQLPSPVAIVAHGGTIMAVMERYARPARSYFDYSVPNGCGFVLSEDGSYSAICPPGADIDSDFKRIYNLNDK